MQGFIFYLDEEKGYGYIRLPERGKKDLPFQITPGSGLKKGDTVVFDFVPSPKGGYAQNVRRLERNDAKFSTEDKGSWVEEGAGLEVEFVANIVPRLGRNIIINPEKERDPCVIDLWDCDRRRYADLKTQETPFFSAGKKYSAFGYDPQYTVTFNHKDYQRYCRLYPGCDIYYHVNWRQTEGYGVRVEPMEGVWVASFADMRRLIEGGEVALHPYQFRRGDQINAKDSYLFDLRNPVFTRLL